ncbi:tetratricopeptide repeat protein [Planctomicrobium sp. SH668]|uniref:tetratricopeptide repeat protein n=1 Tax=Planctomicrobium sp. SH668 TaxID=3448126 RepID=UPI003F5B8EC9
MKRISLGLVLGVALSGCGSNGDSTVHVDASPAIMTDAPAVTNPEEAATSAPVSPAFSYEELLKIADEHFSKNELNKSVQSLTQAIQLQPKSAAAYLKRAAILSKAQNMPQAIADMTAAIQIEPENTKYLNTRGYFYLQSKQYESADADFSDAIGFDFSYPQPYNNRGLIYLSKGDFELALKDFDNALKAKPDYVDALNNRGFALMQLEKLEEAEQAFSAALAIDPNYLNAITSRSRVAMQLGKHDLAISDLTKALEIQPDHVQHYFSRSEAFAAKKDEVAAARDFKYANWLRTLNELNQRIVNSPRDSHLWLTRAQHLMLQDRNDEASHSLQNALTLNPKFRDALLTRAQLEMKAGNYEKVVADCTSALAEEFGYSAHSLRGDAYFEMQKFGDAIADYESARRIDEHVAEAYRQRAAQLRTAGDEGLAKADEDFAQGLIRQLAEAPAKPADAIEPREVVIEQTSYEEAVPSEPAPFPVPAE